MRSEHVQEIEDAWSASDAEKDAEIARLRTEIEQLHAEITRLRSLVNQTEYGLIAD